MFGVSQKGRDPSDPCVVPPLGGQTTPDHPQPQDQRRNEEERPQPADGHGRGDHQSGPHDETRARRGRGAALGDSLLEGAPVDAAELHHGHRGRGWIPVEEAVDHAGHVPATREVQRERPEVLGGRPHVQTVRPRSLQVATEGVGSHALEDGLVRHVDPQVVGTQDALRVGARGDGGEVMDPRAAGDVARRPGHSVGAALWARSSRRTPPTRGWWGLAARNQLSTTGKRASEVNAGMKKAACHGRSSVGQAGSSHSSRGRRGKMLASIQTPPCLHSRARRRTSVKASVDMEVRTASSGSST